MAPICTPLKRESGFDLLPIEHLKRDGVNEMAAATDAAEPMNLRRDTPRPLPELLKLSMKSFIKLKIFKNI